MFSDWWRGPRLASVRLIACAIGFPNCRGREELLLICATDIGSTFRRIVGSFAHGKYHQRSIEMRTLGVGDALARYGR